MSFATDLFSGLAGFRDHLVEVGSELVHAVEADMGKLALPLAHDVVQAEAVAKEILHGLYTGATPAPAPAAAPVTDTVATPTEPAAPAEPTGAETPAAPAEAAPAAEPPNFTA